MARLGAANGVRISAEFPGDLPPVLVDQTRRWPSFSALIERPSGQSADKPHHLGYQSSDGLMEFLKWREEMQPVLSLRRSNRSIAR